MASAAPVSCSISTGRFTGVLVWLQLHKATWNGFSMAAFAGWWIFIKLALPCMPLYASHTYYVCRHGMYCLMPVLKQSTSCVSGHDEPIFELVRVTSYQVFNGLRPHNQATSPTDHLEPECMIGMSHHTISGSCYTGRSILTSSQICNSAHWLTAGW